jgi:hypothetical protein
MIKQIVLNAPRLYTKQETYKEKGQDQTSETVAYITWSARALKQIPWIIVSENISSRIKRNIRLLLSLYLSGHISSVFEGTGGGGDEDMKRQYCSVYINYLVASKMTLRNVVLHFTRVIAVCETFSDFMLSWRRIAAFDNTLIWNTHSFLLSTHFSSPVKSQNRPIFSSGSTIRRLIQPFCIWSLSLLFPSCGV